MPRILSRTRPSHPAIPAKTAIYRRKEAYERLGVTEAEVGSHPKITHILRELPGKIDMAIEFLRGSSEPEARKWIAVYDSLSAADRKLLPFEAITVAAGFSTRRILEVVTGACFEQSTIAAQLISKAAHPEIVKKSVELAKEPENWEDRKMLHQKEGFAPVPKTQVINLNAGGDIDASDNRVQNIGVGQLAMVDRKMKEVEDRFNESIGLGERDELKQIEGEVIEAEVGDGNSDSDSGRDAPGGSGDSDIPAEDDNGKVKKRRWRL